MRSVQGLGEGIFGVLGVVVLSGAGAHRPLQDASASAAELSPQEEALRERLIEALHAVEGPPLDLSRSGEQDAALALMDPLLGTPGLRWPVGDREVMNLEDCSSSIFYSYLLRGWDRAAEGQPESGLADLLSAWEMGAWFARSSETILSANSWLSMEREALRELGEFLETYPEPMLLSRVEQTLDAPPLESDGIDRLNNSTHRELLVLLDGDPETLAQGMDVWRQRRELSWSERLSTWLLLDRDATLELAAELHQWNHENGAIPAYARPQWRGEGHERILDELFWGYNRTGESLIYSTMIGDRTRHQMDLRDAARVGLKTWIGVLRYRQDRGRSPSEITELVPNYLSEMPMDPMTGAAPLYFPQSGRVVCPSESGWTRWGR